MEEVSQVMGMGGGLWERTPWERRHGEREEKVLASGRATWLQEVR